MILIFVFFFFTPSIFASDLSKSLIQPPKPISAQIERKYISGKDIIAKAMQFVGETETKGPNRSPFIDLINNFANAPLGSPYCSSFVSWILYEVGIRNAPITAWSPTMVSKNNIPFDQIETGDVFGLFFASKQRIAHVGFIDNPFYKENFLSTVEANTSPTATVGSEADRNGDGIYRKIRSKLLMKNPRNKFSRYRS